MGGWVGGGTPHTSLGCTGSGFLQGEVGPVHRHLLPRLLGRVQAEPVRERGQPPLASSPSAPQQQGSAPLGLPPHLLKYSTSLSVSSISAPSRSLGRNTSSGKAEEQ